jgi:hypothetical protein
MGKTCNLYIENKHSCNYNNSSESIFDDKCTSNKMINEFYYNNSVVYDHNSKKKKVVFSNYRTLGDSNYKLKTCYSQLLTPKCNKLTHKNKSKLHSPFSSYTNTLNTINAKVTSPTIARNISFSPNTKIKQHNIKHKISFYGFNKSANKYKENKNIFLKIEKTKSDLDKFRFQKSDCFF